MFARFSWITFFIARHYTVENEDVVKCFDSVRNKFEGKALGLRDLKF